MIRESRQLKAMAGVPQDWGLPEEEVQRLSPSSCGQLNLCLQISLDYRSKLQKAEAKVVELERFTQHLENERSVVPRAALASV